MRVAFVKYGGLAAGGTERLLQEIAIEIAKLGATVEYFYCDPKQSPGSSWVHPPNDERRKRHLEKNAIRLTKFEISHKDLSKPDHPWISSNFFDFFREKDFDLVWTAKAGPPEFPFNKLNIPFVETVTLDAGYDTSPNRIHSIHISSWQRSSWIKKGGNRETSSLLPIPVPNPVDVGNLRHELGIAKEKIVIGFHQRVDNAIASKVPFKALSAVSDTNIQFVVMGGGSAYKEFAKELKIDCKFVDHDSSWISISRFLRTLDIYAHGRNDGETYGTVLAEAMNYGIPVVTHRSLHGANAHVETIGAGGLFAYSLREYSQALEKFANNPEERKRYGQLGLGIARRQYSENIFKLRVAEIYANVKKSFENRVNQIQFKVTPEVPEVLPGTRVMVNGFSMEEIGNKEDVAEFISNFFRFLNRHFQGKYLEIQASGILPMLVAIEIERGQVGLIPISSSKIFTSTEVELLAANGISRSEIRFSEVEDLHQTLLIKIKNGLSVGFCDAELAEMVRCRRDLNYRQIPLRIGQDKLTGSWIFVFSGSRIQLVRFYLFAVNFSIILRVGKASERYVHWSENSKTGKRVKHLRFLVANILART